MVIIAAIGVFLLWRAIPALARNEENFFLYGGNWVTTDTSAMHFGILDLLQVTVFVSVFALVLAMPVAFGIALFITQYAPRRLARPLAYMVDLLAAMPSIVYGVWGLYVLAPVLEPFALWLNDNLGWLFLFKTGNASVAGGGTIFTAGIVLAVMILPIITAVTRDVFERTPRGQIEAALALGATRWEMVRIAVLPFGRSGVHQRRDARPGPRARRDDRDLLIILRGTSAAVHLVALRRRLDLRLARSRTPQRIQRPVQGRRLHRRRPGAVRPDVRGQRAGPGRRQPRKEFVMTPTLDRPAQGRRPSRASSLRRKVKNNVATVLVDARRSVIALVPAGVGAVDR